MSELYKGAEEIVRDHAHREPRQRRSRPVALAWPPGHRLLATVLFTDIVDSIRQVAEIGDWRWGELLRQHGVIVRRELARFGGREVNTAGDAFLIAFDGPGRAIRRGLSVSRQYARWVSTACRDPYRNALSDGGVSTENSRLKLVPAHSGSSQGVCGHPHFSR